MASSWTSMLMALFCCISLNCFSLVDSRQLPDLYWNSSNPLFQSDPDGEAYMMTAEIMDSLTIHCPHYNDSTLSKDTEQATIFRVNKAGFDKCYVDEKTSQPVAMCADPFNVVTIPLVFRQYTPVPSGLEYQPGNTYYFISTSDGSKDGLNFRKHGLCYEQNLRLKIVIKRQEEKLDSGVVEDTGAEQDADVYDNTFDNEDDRSALSPKFRWPKTHHPNSKPPVLSANPMDSYLASVFAAGSDGTTPSYYNNFMRNVLNGKVGQERFTQTTSSPSWQAFAQSNDGLEEDGQDDTAMTYKVVDIVPTDTNRRRGLRAKEEESKRGLHAQELPATASEDAGADDLNFLIDEHSGDSPSSLHSGSLSSRRTLSFSASLLLLFSLVAVVRWLL